MHHPSLLFLQPAATSLPLSVIDFWLYTEKGGGGNDTKRVGTVTLLLAWFDLSLIFSSLVSFSSSFFLLLLLERREAQHDGGGETVECQTLRQSTLRLYRNR